MTLKSMRVCAGRTPWLIAVAICTGCISIEARFGGSGPEAKQQAEQPPLTPVAQQDLSESDHSAENAAQEIAPVQFLEPIEANESPVESLMATQPLEGTESPIGARQETYPIDLPTALRLAGANNLQIAFANEQVEQAWARVDAADVLWVPSLNAGVIYNNHAGRIQETEGNVREASRNSLFVGGGAVTANAPVAGGASGPARMFVDLPLVDVLFEPLAARQVAQGAQANLSATFNDTLLRTAWAYQDLVQAGAQVIVAEEAVRHAEELVRLTEDFAQSGSGLQADADRARAELAARQRDVLQFRESQAVASAELARVLRLDPAVRLEPAENRPLQLFLTESGHDVYSLIARAHACRPEIRRAASAVSETCYRVQQEHWRPYVPHLYAGYSAGGFGGAPGSAIDNFGGRSDFDIGAVWQVQNLGLGNLARRDERDSLHRQAHVTLDQAREQVAMEVVQAYEQIRLRDEQVETTEVQIRSAQSSLELSLEGIRGGALRPIEIQQAIGALATAQREHVDAIVNHNRAQFSLLRAIGQPVTEGDLMQPGSF